MVRQTTTASILTDPDTFVDGPPHEWLAELRRSEPVSWQEMDGEPGFFAVLTHAGVVAVAREPVLFSVSAGGMMLEDPAPENLEQNRQMLVAMDPPRHGQYRRPVATSFKARMIGRLEEQIREICRQIMADTRAAGGEVEFVHDVTATLPTRVMGRMMGLPEADWPYVHDLAERMLATQDPDFSPSADDRSSLAEMAVYAMNFAAERRRQPPADDLTTVILEADYGGHAMSDQEFGSFFVQLVGAGNDTTKTLTSSGLVALLRHPDQLAELREDPERIPGAVEEILRWANPVHYARRTATADTELQGVPIRRGQKVVMYFTSANRDEAVFADPQRFDIHRYPNPHLAFGIAEHFCLGVHLARLEGRVFFEELLAAFAHIELAGEPVRLRSNFNNAYKRVPVSLR